MGGLTVEQANNPAYRDWLTLFVNNEKVRQPVAAYQENNHEAALSV